jgi:hypothetical protein
MFIGSFLQQLHQHRAGFCGRLTERTAGTSLI